MYRKFTSDQIFSGEDFLPPHTVLIANAEGEILDMVDAADAGEDIERFEGILSPGFINCHCHLELAHLKGIIPRQTGMIDFLLGVMGQRQMEIAVIFEAIEKAEDEMISEGIVAVGDICNTAHTIAQKRKGRLLYHNFIETAGFSPSIADSRFQQSSDLYNLFAADLPRQSIVPHAPYSVSLELLNKINQHKVDGIITMHNQESLAENDFYLNKQGDFLRLYESLNIPIDFFSPTHQSSLQSFLPFFRKMQSMILVHNVFSSEEDIAIANAFFDQQQSALYYCLCPIANLYISNTLPPLSLLMKQSSNIVLGTDSLASNTQLSMIKEIQALQNAFPFLQLKELLQWATFNGAKALGMEDTLGSFKKGKTPGVILIKGNTVTTILKAKGTR